jgi:hypothetical protein
LRSSLSRRVVETFRWNVWKLILFTNAQQLNYSPQEVANSQPLRAIHEMGMGGETPIPFLPKAQPQPAIAIPETVYDFGSMGPKEIVKKTFVIRNTGKESLTISKAYTTCGCTTADFTSSVIPPGKVALVTVTFDAGFHDTRGQTVQRGVIGNRRGAPTCAHPTIKSNPQF